MAAPVWRLWRFRTWQPTHTSRQSDVSKRKHFKMLLKCPDPVSNWLSLQPEDPKKKKRCIADLRTISFVDSFSRNIYLSNNLIMNLCRLAYPSKESSSTQIHHRAGLDSRDPQAAEGQSSRTVVQGLHQQQRYQWRQEDLCADPRQHSGHNSLNHVAKTDSYIGQKNQGKTQRMQDSRTPRILWTKLLQRFAVRGLRRCHLVVLPRLRLKQSQFHRWRRKKNVDVKPKLERPPRSDYKLNWNFGVRSDNRIPRHKTIQNKCLVDSRDLLAINFSFDSRECSRGCALDTGEVNNSKNSFFSNGAVKDFKDFWYDLERANMCTRVYTAQHQIRASQERPKRQLPASKVITNFLKQVTWFSGNRNHKRNHVVLKFELSCSWPKPRVYVLSMKPSNLLPILALLATIPYPQQCNDFATWHHSSKMHACQQCGVLYFSGGNLRWRGTILPCSVVAGVQRESIWCVLSTLGWVSMKKHPK